MRRGAMAPMGWPGNSYDTGSAVSIIDDNLEGDVGSVYTFFELDLRASSCFPCF